ncbi:hypothetical protein GDO86_016975 [Hymenochirus boettgeri]|uniref:G protein gamma domain-containing protein n=1 Tax=Hymenochirus boettgeri TaxID=247094 RepID=A0A8T2IIH6_9PIPI|nr:hypothetical protein GDO86_016975 [Hymenochirus boettgeri]
MTYAFQPISTGRPQVLEFSLLNLSECHEMEDLEERLHMKHEDFVRRSIDNGCPQENAQQVLGSQHLQVLPNAAQEHNGMIDPLSRSLQQEYQEEKQAFVLPSSQIQTTELQFNEATVFSFRKTPEYGLLDTRAKDLEKQLETSQKAAKDNENEMAKLENLMHEQERKLGLLQVELVTSELSVSVLKRELSEKNQEMNELQNKLGVRMQTDYGQPVLETKEIRHGVDKDHQCPIAGEDNTQSLLELITDLREKLAQSETLRLDLCKKLEVQLMEFERERESWEQKHSDVVSNLTLQLKHAEEQAEKTAAQDKQEKERLNEELRSLKDRLRLEAENNQALKTQHENDLQIYMRKLHNLEEEQENMHQKLVKTKCEEKVCGDGSPKHECKVEGFRHELEDLKKTLNRVKAMKDHENYEENLQNVEKEDESLNQFSDTLDYMNKYLVPSDSPELDCHENTHFELDSDFVLEQSFSSSTEGNINLLCSPMPITGVLKGGASAGTLLDPECFAVYLSNNLRSPESQNEFSALCDESLLQKCSVLVDQLQEREEQLQKCSSELEETLAKWTEVTAELTAAKLELEREKSKGGDLIKYEIMVEELQSEKDTLRKQIFELELKNVQDQCKSGEELGTERESIKCSLSVKEHLTQLLNEKECLKNKLSSVEHELANALEICNELQTNNDNLKQSLQNAHKSREFDLQEFDNKLNAKGMEQQLLCSAIKEKEAEFTDKEMSLCEEICTLKQVKEELERRLQEEGHYTHKLRQVKAVSTENSVETAFSGRSEHNMEVEALKLSLNNLHTAHLELCQSNLQKEKEDALVQLREQLNNKWAQEVAMVQGRYQFEMENLHSQHSKAIEQLVVQHSNEMEKLREVHAGELLQLKAAQSQEVSELQELFVKEKQHAKEQEEWVKKEHNLGCLKELVLCEMSLRHEEDMKNLNKVLENERKICKELTVQKENKKVFMQSESEEMQEMLESKVNGNAEMRDSDQENQPHRKSPQLRSTIELENSTGKRDHTQDSTQMPEFYEIRSSQENQLFWSQLDGARSNRLELNELKEQLLTRSAQVEEIGRLKQDFEQQRQQVKIEHEKEMEELRIYFEQKSRITEENYREELEMLLQRLREMKDDDREELAIHNCSALSLEKEQSHLLQQLTDELVQHKEELCYLRLQSEEKHKQDLETLRSSLTFQCKEDMLNMEMDLSERYISEMESLKKRHCLELEQLRARLSEKYIREIRKLHLCKSEDTNHLAGDEAEDSFQCFEDDFQSWLSLLPENQNVMEMVHPLEQSIIDQQHVLNQDAKLQGTQMEKKDQICQTESRLLPENLSGNILNSSMCEENNKEDGNVLRGLHSEPPRDAQLQMLKEQHEKELTALKEQMSRELDMVTHRLQEKHEHEYIRFQQEFQENPDKLHKLRNVLHKEGLKSCVISRDQSIPKGLYEQHQEIQSNGLSDMQPNNEELTFAISKQQGYLSADESELQDLHEENVSYEQQELNSVSELQHQHERELDNHVGQLQQQHEEKLRNHLSDLRQLLKEEHSNHVLELHRQHEEELCNRMSELQLQHEDALSKRVSELQQQYDKEINKRVFELQHKHKEELEFLVSEHKVQVEQLESTHMSNMDTLESSYLSEIQKIRDEHTQSLVELEICLADRLQEKEREMMDKLAIAESQSHEKHMQELQLLREVLGKELATVHLEKFQAMSQELESAHKEELKRKLDNQRSVLVQEKIQALDSLQGELQKIELENQFSLQELRDLHLVEVQKSLEQTQILQDELSKLTDQLQEQELLMAKLHSERQALTAELQVKTDQQLQLQKETELLKCQSEMLLEQQITKLKMEFEAEQIVSLQRLEEQFRSEAEKVQAAHQMELDQMTGQLQEKSRLILQLQENECQLEELAQRRERENQEGDNLVTMLHSDLHTAQQERDKLQESCQRLLKLFTNVLKNTLSTEDLILKKIGLCLESSLPPLEHKDNWEALGKPWGTPMILRCSDLFEKNEKNCVSPDCETMTEHSIMSSDEGCEVSEYLCDNMLGSLEVGLENEEKIVRMSQRLRSAVEQLLEMVTRSTTQLEHTYEIQQRFHDEFNVRNQEMAHVVLQNQDLKKQLALEVDTKNQLQVELHKAHGLIDGYAAEKATLEESLSKKETAEHLLIVELEKSCEHLKVLSQEPSVFGEEREVLLKLQEVLSGSAKNVETELLKETERLAQEKLELHCQAKKDQSNLQSQLKVLEMELEEQMSCNQELKRRTSEMSDLQQQIQSLEKQLKNQRHFMDEQAVEREHERDEFQQEIQKLEEQLKIALKNQGDSRIYGIENLEAQVKEKTANCHLLLQGKDNLEQQIAERNEEIDKMLLRIQELEEAVLINADAAKKCSQVEVELQRMRKSHEEILQDKDALQKQQYNNALQISALQSKVDEARHRVPLVGESENILLKEQLQAEHEALLIKEKEVENLAEQLEQFREDLMNKTEEVLQLNMQLEVQHKRSELVVHEFQEDVLQLKEEVSLLKLQRKQDRSNTTLELPQALLQEKNQEIDHLNEQLLRLQQELEKETVNSQGSEVDELRSLVEHLRSDIDRLRKDKEDEVEQLHEVIEKLQHELGQLGPNRHEISDSQESLDHLGLGEVENLKRELKKGALQLQEESFTELDQVSKVKEIKCLLEEATTFKTEVNTLHQQLEESQAQHIAEVEVLEQNLHNLQESKRQKIQEIDFLSMELTSLKKEHELLRTLLSQRDYDLTILSSQLVKCEDLLREKEALLIEKELLIQTLNEQKHADKAELEEQLAQKSDVLKELLERSSIDQQEKDERHKTEINELKNHLKMWEDKAEILTAELQKIKLQEAGNDPLLSAPETEERLVAINEQLRTAENLLKEKDEELCTTKVLVSSMKEKLEKLKVECECREARAQQVTQQLKRRYASVAELKSHSQNLEAQVQKLQKHLESQEFAITSMSEELQNQNMEGRQYTFTHMRSFVKPRSFTESLTDLSDWDSPDMVRKQEERLNSVRAYTPFSDLSIEYSTDHDVIPSKSSEYKKQPTNCDVLVSRSPSLNRSRYSDAHRSSPVGNNEHSLMESDYSDDQSDSEKDILTGHKLEYLSNEGLSANLQTMLHMIHEESCKILALSQHPADQTPNTPNQGDVVQSNTWQQDKQTLQEAMQSLSTALTQAATNQEKDFPDFAPDWRNELLQSVQSLLESERDFLCLELQSHLSSHGSGDKGSLSERIEHLIKTQEEQKCLVMEQLLSSDRSSLLSEIQDLRAQLRMAHLQNQEKLQQLQETLTNTEERGNIREHQLRRQMELMEYKLQQEGSISSDLKASLSHEIEKASEQQKLLLLEQSSVNELRVEKEEWLLEQERRLKTQNELNTEITKLREELESKEQSLSLSIKTMKTHKELENKRMEEEKLLLHQTQDRYERTLQEMTASVEELQLQNNRLSAALQHEQTCCSNIKKELQIEQSRFEALLALEHSKLSEIEKELEKERHQSLGLSSTLTLERNMIEQLRHQHCQELSRKEQERLQEYNNVLTLKRHLDEERSQAKDLATMMEKTQQQAISAKRQMEAEIQTSREETQKEKETSIKIRAMLDSLQSQKQHLDSILEQLKVRESNLQKERDQYQAQILLYQEEERLWAKEKEKMKEQKMEAKTALEGEKERRILDLQIQHERDQHRIKELQLMLAELEEQERAMATRKLHLQKDTASPAKGLSDIAAMYAKGLENVWQKLFQTVLQVKDWGKDRNLESCIEEKSVTSLLDMLQELKSELKRACVKPPLSISVIDVLQSENEELTKTVTALTKDKMDLKSQLAHLKNLQKPLGKSLRSAENIESILEAERAAWHRERRQLQIALRHAESELAKVTLENQPVPDVPNTKMQRLHRKYLRAESFRKALVYQKKYLLLLLGGFQACEKATLCLIARMGVHPSPADLQISSPHQPALKKFRSAVRAVIAISRLKFLVKKWNKINKVNTEDPSIQNSPLFKHDSSIPIVS